MSDTPPMNNDLPLNGRDRTPELTSKREKRTRDDEDDDRSRSGRRRHEREREHDEDRERERDLGDRDSERDRERRHRRHRHHDEEGGGDDEERRERRRRHHERDREETEEEREERRRRRREREDRHRERERDRSRESHRSHPRDRHDDRDRERGPERDVDRKRDGNSAYLEMSREEKEREREKRDREMQEERREAARMREERYGQMGRDRDADRRRYRDDRPPPPAHHDRRDSLPPRPPMSPPPRRRGSPTYDRPGPRGSPPPPPPPKDPVVQLLEEVDKEQRSVFVSQIASRLTSQDLGDFFVEMLGPKAVRDARVVTDKVSRRSKGIGYVELDSVEQLNKALSLSGTIVMGIPISIKQTESERNREGQMEAAMAKLKSGEWEREERQRERQRPQRQYAPKFPPLSTGLAIPPGLDVDAHKHASIPYHRLYITSLAYSLTPDDVSQVFEAFGPIEFVDLHRDHHGSSKGSAYVQFQNLSSAQMALDAMDNFELAGRNIRVSAVEDRSQARDVIEDTSYAPRMDANARRDLMQKLARTDTPQAPASRPPPPPPEQVQPTPYILVGNMFNPDEETERNWDLDMAEDIKGEVEDKYGPVRRIKVDKMSRGDVYIEFDGVASATRGHDGLKGRFFGGKQLTCGYITEGIFRAHM